MNKLYTTLFAVSLSSLFFAQQNAILTEGAKVDYVSNRTNLPLQVSFDDTKHLNETQFTELLKKEIVKNEAVSFSHLKTNYDPSGNRHSRYQQYYKGYKMEGSMIIAHYKNNEVRSFNGDWYKDISLSNAISITGEQALQAALKKVNAKKYKWENKAEEMYVQQALNNPNFSYTPVAEIVVLPSISKNKTITYQYAYKLSIYAEEPLYKANVYVDAATGVIIKEQNQICTIDAPGTANTKYSGTQPIVTDSYAAGFRLRETGRGNGVETYNMKNTQTYSVTDFTNTVNSWTITTADQAATDAHFGAEATYDFYFNTFNRNSIDDNGFKLLSYVHYSTNYVNAFWDGLRMTYGDGNISQGYSIMTALDVCGHEITHGVVENTAGLNGGEADALNEGFSDIFGTSVEWAARPAQHDWLMGSDISTTGSAIRDMSNPKSLQQPDTYMGQYWSASAEPHDNAGPCIYWFYLLSVGGSGTNDNSDAYNVTSITMAKAQAIAYRAMAYYMTPGTDYADVRNCTIQAAKDLYGVCSNEVIQTTNAWYAVGVGAQYTTGLIGPNFVASLSPSSCSLPATINFDNTTSAGLSFTWDFGDGTTSTATTTAHTYTANGIYSVKLVATGCVTGTKDSLTRNNYIVINSPVQAVSNDENICSGTSATLTATGNGTINWYDAASGGSLLATGNAFATPTLANSTTYYAVNTMSQTPVFGGPATNTAFGGGSNFNANADRYLIFNVFQACTLKTVKVVSGGAGNRTIELRDAAGTVLQSTVVSIPTGTQTIALNFSLTPGTNYQLGTATLPNMWRNNSGSGYPYHISGLVDITGADAGSSYYYYFYNWEVQGADCQSAATAVTASVSICTGLNEARAENSVKLYPNPAADKLTFNLSEELANTTKSIEVYDALGKTVQIIPVTSEQTEINVSGLAKGVYTCRLVNTSNQTIVKRFVKE